MKQLDENGFVFLDDNGNPFWMRMQGDSAWIYRWHVDKRWVSLRRVNQTEVWLANEKALPEDQAKLYHDLSNR